MLHKPSDGQQVFEVSIYNREVRSLVKENQSHSLFDDHWADSHKHDVCACDESEARRLVASRYPPDDGFGIEAVTITAL